MKKIYILLFIIWCINFAGFSQNNYCNTALPFTTGLTYTFPAGVNSGTAEAGPNYGCLLSQPNPAWYYMQVADSGPINIHLSTNPAQDVDFVCWGPFTSPSAPCTSQLTANCTSCPNNTVNPSFYPSGNLVDCSFSTGWQEDCNIANAVTGEWYIFMITNYSNQACNIIFEQTNSLATSHGTTNAAIMSQTNIKDVIVKSELSVFPNPFSKSTTIKFSNTDKKPCTITISDITGKTVRLYKDITTDIITIEKGDLKNGIYSIEINGELIQREKLVVE
ncbi:MAG: T9SS type A sorting domain-containing protein [Bacteroidia bacterium]|nr:T9SS type A sorting domain-containing protein [Bacteroidia bacterium]